MMLALVVLEREIHVTATRLLEDDRTVQLVETLDVQVICEPIVKYVGLK
jgi:hypothetical protein